MKSRFLHPALPFLALPLLSVPALAQATGVSHPEQDDTVATAPAQQTDHYVMPSRAASSQPQAAALAPTPATSYPATGPVPDASYPATGPAPADNTAQAPALIVRQPSPTAAPTTTYAVAPATAYATEPYAPAQTAGLHSHPKDDADYGVVEEVASAPHQLHGGTVLKVRLNQRISTESTAVNTPFSADLLADVDRRGEVLLPAGSVVRGHVASIHGGKRIGGLAAIRLQPESVTLPDGTIYPLRATVSDVDGDQDSHVNDEGAIQPKTHPKAVLAVLGFTTGTAAVAGAVIGGGVGAAAGACIGAGVGAIWWLKRDHQETLDPGTTIYLSLDAPLQMNPR